MAHFVTRGLEHRFGVSLVRFVPWGVTVRVGPHDVLVTCLPNVNYGRTRRIVALENDTLRQSRWDTPTAELYGRSWRVDDVRSLRDRLSGIAGVVVLTNEVALARLAAREPDYTARDAALRSFVGFVAYTVHPMDKEAFRSRMPKGRFRRGAPIAVHNAGWRKSSAEIIAIAIEAGLRPGRDFVPFAHLAKESLSAMAFFRWRFNIVASASVSESGPVNLLEFLYQGFHILGHEEWWPDVGPLSRFTYDPAQRDEMRELLRTLADPKTTDAVQAERDRILAAHLGRTDNTWDHYLGLVNAAVEHALAS